MALPGPVGAGHRRLLGLLLPSPKVGDASKVAPVDNLSLVLVAVFAFLFLGERPSVRDWIGILMVAAGVLILGFKR